MARLSPSQRAVVRVEVETERLSRALGRYITRTRAGVRETVEAVAFELEGKIKERAPVDTGRARASVHTVTLRTGAQTYAFKNRRTGRSETYDGTLSARPQGDYEAIVGTNVAYWPALEAGHSQQAPNGAFRISAIEIRGELTRRLQGRR